MIVCTNKKNKKFLEDLILIFYILFQNIIFYLYTGRDLLYHFSVDGIGNVI